MTPALLVRVAGTPRGQGSVRALPNGGVTYSEKVYEWRHVLTTAAREHYRSDPLTGPVGLTLTFDLDRPAGHYGTGANDGLLRLRAPRLPQTRPDLDKLTRCVLDALTDARVWLDDSQVAEVWARKVYTTRYRGPGVSIAVYELPLAAAPAAPVEASGPAVPTGAPPASQLVLPGMEDV